MKCWPVSNDKSGGDGAGAGASSASSSAASSTKPGAPDGAEKDKGNPEPGSGPQLPQKRKWFDRDAAINAQRRGLRSSLSTLQTQLASVLGDLRNSVDSVARLPSAQQKVYLGEAGGLLKVGRGWMLCPRLRSFLNAIHWHEISTGRCGKESSTTSFVQMEKCL